MTSTDDKTEPVSFSFELSVDELERIIGGNGSGMELVYVELVYVRN